jgi:hypothetical protein
MSIHMPEAKVIYRSLPRERQAELLKLAKDLVPAGLYGPDERKLAAIRYIADHIEQFRG